MALIKVFLKEELKTVLFQKGNDSKRSDSGEMLTEKEVKVIAEKNPKYFVYNNIKKKE